MTIFLLGFCIFNTILFLVTAYYIKLLNRSTLLLKVFANHSIPILEASQALCKLMAVKLMSEDSDDDSDWLDDFEPDSTDRSSYN